MSKEQQTDQNPKPGKPGIFTELRRRKVFRAAGAYLVVAWLVIQAASIVLPTFEVPAWTMRLIIIFASLGFPLVVVLAWAFELTPDGMKLTPDAEKEDAEVRSPTHDRKRNLAAFGLGAAVPSIGILVLVVILILNPGKQDSSDLDSEKSIAVLPFNNLSSDEENAFFAGGVHEDILTNLAKIKDLKVISRTSVMRYQDKPDNLRIIGEELGARYIVEGSVRRSGDDVRITIQLIDASNDQHLYAENFDRKLENIFVLQSDIAQEIAGILQATISPEEKALLNAVPTDNIPAYEAFVKARGIISFNWTDFDILRGAISQLEFATKADPQFVEAWSSLVMGYGQLSWQLSSVADAEEELKEVNRLLDDALSTARNLDPENVATLRAEAYYYHVIKRDYLSALRSIDKALTLVPNNADSIAFLGYIYRRLGESEKALGQFEKAYVIDKANIPLINDLIFTYELNRKFDKIAPLYEQLATLDKEQTNFQIEARHYQFLADGSLESFLEFENALHTVEKTEKCNLATWRYGHMTCALLKGEFDSYAENWKTQWQLHYEGHGDYVCPVQINEEANHASIFYQSGDEAYARKVVQKALHEISLPIREDSGCIVETALILPKLQYLNGEKEAAQIEFQKALIKFNESENSFRKMWEKLILLETADMVVPDQVYQMYREFADEPSGMVSMEFICANPRNFPNLLKSPEFQKEIREDGRFIEFLRHFELI